jgi:hypothetical protein
MSLAVLSFFWALCFLNGCAAFSRVMWPKFNAPWALKSLSGFLLPFGILMIVEFFFWNKSYEDFLWLSNLLLSLKWFAVLWGILDAIANVKKKDWRRRVKQPEFLMLVLVGLLMLPAALLWAGVHAGWDWDAITMWNQRSMVYSLRGLRVAKDELDFNGYTGLASALVGYAIPSWTPSLWFLQVGRFVSLILTLSFVGNLVSSLDRPLVRVCAVLFFFPGISSVRWINGYQDLWLAVCTVVAFRNYLRDPKDWMGYLFPLVISAGIKNEGFVVGGLLGLFFILRSSLRGELSFRSLKRKPVMVMMAAIASVLGWQIFVMLLPINNRDLALQFPGYYKLLVARPLFLLKMTGHLVHRFDRSFAPGAFLACTYILVGGKKVTRDQRIYLGVFLVLVFVPFVPILMTPNDFQEHIGTTIHRLTSTGFLLLIWLAIECADRDFGARNRK